MSNVNKSAYWLLILVFGLSIFIVIETSMEWLRANTINAHIAEPNINDLEKAPSHPLALFAFAYTLEQQGKPQEALDFYTQLLSKFKGQSLAETYYNRAIISLKQAALMQNGDPKQNPLIELAKQDLRHALEISPHYWDARFNLEVALNLVPELPIDGGDFEKNEISSSRSIEAVGFRIDLP
jgi:mxaK protein